MNSNARDFFHLDGKHHIDFNQSKSLAQYFDFDHFQTFFQKPHFAPPPHSTPTPSSGVDYRSVDGSGNNLLHSEFNQAGSDFTRAGPANFADGVSELVSTPNARMISNVVVAGNGDLANTEGLSGMMYAWGQFIDHDLTLANSQGGTTHIDVTVPDDDPFLTPGSIIPITRVPIDPATGHAGTPAIAISALEPVGRLTN